MSFKPNETVYIVQFIFHSLLYDHACVNLKSMLNVVMSIICEPSRTISYKIVQKLSASFRGKPWKKRFLDGYVGKPANPFQFSNMSWKEDVDPKSSNVSDF